jgi:chromate transporter
LGWREGIQSIFYTIGAAGHRIIANSAHGLMRKTIGRDALLWAIFLVLAACNDTGP